MTDIKSKMSGYRPSAGNTLIMLSAAAALCGLASCKTSEANYKAAYDKAVAGRDSLTAIENTIYGRHRRAVTSNIAVAGNDTVEMITARVSVTEGGGGIRENLRPYSVVVGQFKQLVNAKSMRERLVDAGYPTAFVVQTAEPYYYIILNSYTDKGQAVKAAAETAASSSFPIAMKEPMPMVLYVPR